MTNLFHASWMLSTSSTLKLAQCGELTARGGPTGLPLPYLFSNSLEILLMPKGSADMAEAGDRDVAKRETGMKNFVFHNEDASVD